MTEHVNERRIRAAFAAFATGDYDAAAAVVAADCHYRVNGRSPISGVHSGRDAIIGLFATLHERTTGTFTAEPFEVFANDRNAVALVDVTAERGGVPIAYALVIVATFQDDRIVEMWSITDDPYRVDPFWED